MDHFIIMPVLFLLLSIISWSFCYIWMNDCRLLVWVTRVQWIKQWNHQRTAAKCMKTRKDRVFKLFRWITGLNHKDWCRQDLLQPIMELLIIHSTHTHLNTHTFMCCYFNTPPDSLIFWHLWCILNSKLKIKAGKPKDNKQFNWRTLD